LSFSTNDPSEKLIDYRNQLVIGQINIMNGLK